MLENKNADSAQILQIKIVSALKMTLRAQNQHPMKIHQQKDQNKLILSFDTGSGMQNLVKITFGEVCIVQIELKLISNFPKTHHDYILRTISEFNAQNPILNTKFIFKQNLKTILFKIFLHTFDLSPSLNYFLSYFQDIYAYWKKFTLKLKEKQEASIISKNRFCSTKLINELRKVISMSIFEKNNKQAEGKGVENIINAIINEKKMKNRDSLVSCYEKVRMKSLSEEKSRGRIKNQNQILRKFQIATVKNSVSLSSKKAQVEKIEATFELISDETRDRERKKNSACLVQKRPLKENYAHFDTEFKAIQWLKVQKCSQIGQFFIQNTTNISQIVQPEPVFYSNFYQNKLQKRRSSFHCLKILLNFSRGLYFLAKNEILHRNLKPSHILIDKNLNPRIIGFGESSRTLRIIKRKGCWNLNQRLMSTKHFNLCYDDLPMEWKQIISPSCFEHHHNFDMHAFGVVLNEILNLGTPSQEVDGFILDNLDWLRKSQTCLNPDYRLHAEHLLIFMKELYKYCVRSKKIDY